MTSAPEPPRPRLSAPVSLLDRSRTRVGEPGHTALRDTLDRAGRADRLGLHRFWVAEHHAVPGIASGSPAVLMAAIAERTDRIRVGSGGIMLPNHRPIIVAEQARMLTALHPDRIDLGVGRSLGFTGPVRDALGVHEYPPERFAEDLSRLRELLHDEGAVTAMPSGVAPPDLFVLATGSGLEVAAAHGLPVVVGGPLLHGDLAPLDRYREHFRPSTAHRHPYVVVSTDVMVAETTARARELVLPEAWAMVESRRTGAFPPLRPEPDRRWTSREQDRIDEHVERAVHGSPSDVARRLALIVERTGADEVLAWVSTHDRTAQDRCDELLAGLSGPAEQDRRC